MLTESEGNVSESDESYMVKVNGFWEDEDSDEEYPIVLNVEVLKNPSYNEVLSIAKKDRGKVVRVMKINGDVYAWAGSKAIHSQIARGLSVGEYMGNGSMFRFSGGKLCYDYGVTMPGKPLSADTLALWFPAR